MARSLLPDARGMRLEAKGFSFSEFQHSDFLAYFPPSGLRFLISDLPALRPAPGVPRLPCVFPHKACDLTHCCLDPPLACFLNRPRSDFPLA